MAQKLSKQFDSLFATTTGYDALDIRIDMTREKKKPLLVSFPYRRVNTKQHSAVDPNSVHQQTV